LEADEHDDHRMSVPGRAGRARGEKTYLGADFALKTPRLAPSRATGSYHGGKFREALDDVRGLGYD
jgi:hypothetical protein